MGAPPTWDQGRIKLGCWDNWAGQKTRQHSSCNSRQLGRVRTVGIFLFNQLLCFVPVDRSGVSAFCVALSLLFWAADLLRAESEMAVSIHNAVSTGAFTSRSTAPRRSMQAQRTSHMRQASPQQQQQQFSSSVAVPSLLHAHSQLHTTSSSGTCSWISPCAKLQHAYACAPIELS